jgi:hypothetical protein
MYGGTLDRSGAWQYEAPYGYVWYPTVDQYWRPYYDGYWSSIRPYGWTWIGFDVWAWPTHHYGRWGLARDRWFWIPERHWNAAWVSWGAAPGYVSWCPLGFDNRPVAGLSLSLGNSRAGWVVVPRRHFGWSNVRQWAIAPHGLPAMTPFVVQASPPVPPPMRSIPLPNVVASSSAALAIPRAVAGRGSQATAGNRQPGADSQPPVVGIRRPGADTRLSVVGIWPQGNGVQRQPSASLSRQPGAASRRSPVVRRQPPSGQRQPAPFERTGRASTGSAQPAQAGGAWPRTAVTRTESSSSSPAPARSDPAPRVEPAPLPAARPAPPSPAPATAVPRSGPPATTGSAAAPRSSSGSGSSGTVPGHGARHQ